MVDILDQMKWLEVRLETGGAYQAGLALAKQVLDERNQVTADSFFHIITKWRGKMSPTGALCCSRWMDDMQN